MKAKDLDRGKLLEFRQGESDLLFNKRRALLFDSEAMGRLRREIILTLGEDRARGVLTRFGYSCGYLDAIRFRDMFVWDSDRDWLDAGIVVQSLKGIVKCEPGEFRVSRPEGLFDCEIFYQNSFEAEEDLKLLGKQTSNRCWSLQGYASGYASAYFGQEIYFHEEYCIAQGHERCRLRGRPFSDWGPAYHKYFRFFKEENVGTELTEVYDQLKSAKERYKGLFENASVPILILDPKTGDILETNHAAKTLSGYDATEIQAMNIGDLCRPNGSMNRGSMGQILMMEGIRDTLELNLARKDGRQREVLADSRLVKSADQTFVQTVLTDVTDLRKSQRKEEELRDQLIRSEKLSAVGKLAAGVGHELRNPLGSIGNALFYIKELLQEKKLLETDETLKEMVILAEREIGRASDIIKDLLDFSRVNRLEMHPTRLNVLLQDLKNSLKVPPNIKLVEEFSPDLQANCRRAPLGWAWHAVKFLFGVEPRILRTKATPGGPPQNPGPPENGPGRRTPASWPPP